MNFKSVLTLLYFLFVSSMNSFGQSMEQDSLCCSCKKVDLEEINKMIKFKSLIKDIEPKYIQHLISLGESENLIQFEKFNYLLKLDKFLKYEISKKLFALEKPSDSANVNLKLQLEFLNESLTEKTKSLNSRITSCKKLTAIQEYINRKNVILSLDANYFSNYINIINSTIDVNKTNFEELEALEKGLMIQLEQRKIVLDNREKLTEHEQKEHLIISKLIAETNDKINTISADKEQTKNELIVSNSENKLVVPKEYYLKQLILNNDTIQFQKGNREKIIVANNTMYIFRNDSLIETIKNEDQKEYTSIFENRKPIPIDNYKGLFYTVQIGTYSKEVSTTQLKVISNIFYKVLENGNIRYSYGMFNDLSEVEQAKVTLKSIGVTDIAVIAYHQTERITLKQAKKMKAELGE